MRISVALAGILVAGAAGMGMAGAAFATCSADAVNISNQGNLMRFSVEIADDDAERNRGLMFREEMPRGAGMLFVFDPPRAVSFWMRNTLIPLDMIFADRRGVVTRVHANAIPGDETPIPGGDDIYTVLEINGGLAERYGITPGAQMQHPVYGDLAAWPCD